MDKFLCRQIWAEAGLPIVPQRKVVELESLSNETLPFVLKPKASGSSVGVTIVKSKDDIKKAFDVIMSQNQEILFEEYIKGRELTVGIINCGQQVEALPIVEIVPNTEFYDYEAKYIRDDTQYIIPAILPKDLAQNIQSIAVKAAKLLEIDTFSRVDFLLDKDNNPYLLEINTIPGLTSHSLLPKAAESAGISFKELLSLMLK